MSIILLTSFHFRCFHVGSLAAGDDFVLLVHSHCATIFTVPNDTVPTTHMRGRMRKESENGKESEVR